MNLNEYQAKRLFGRYGMPVPDGQLAGTPEEAHTAAARIGGRVVIKAQVLTGGRGKAGGIKLAADPNEAAAKAAQILGMRIKGLTVHQVLVDPAAAIAHEFYLAVLVDRGARKPMIMASAAGGVDIEQVNAEQPEAIIKLHVDPLVGLRPFHAWGIASRLGLPAAQWGPFQAVLQSLYDCFVGSDAMLTEINPLAVLADGRFMALDGKVTIDDNALGRQPDLAALRDPDELTPNEQRAAAARINYIQLEGNIGCMVNGAGLAMTAMDVIKLFGGRPANFLDIGGGAKAEQVRAALDIILGDSSVKAVLINIFGGITRGDEVARGILEALGSISTSVPFVVRLEGTNAAEGRAILEAANLSTAETLTEAAQKAVALAHAQV